MTKKNRQKQSATFTKDAGGASSFLPRDETKKRKQQQSTFGQNVQKLEGEQPKAKSEFTADKNTFTEQPPKTEETPQEDSQRKNNALEDYHRRDTYHQSQQKKGNYKKKQVQNEHHRKIKEAPKEATQETQSAKDEFHTKGESFQTDTGNSFVGSEKLERKEKQAQKAKKKVARVRAKLPKNRNYTLQRVFDEKTGKGKYIVVPVETEKTYQGEIVAKTAARHMGNESRNYFHNQMAQVEKENSAVESAHKTEQRAEEAYQHLNSYYKGRHYRLRKKAEKLERKAFRKEVNFQYQKFLEENPQMQKKAIQKRLQKQRIKREYQKAAKKGAAKAAQQAVGKSANAATAVAKKLQEIAGRNAGLFISIGIFAILIIMIMTSVSSCGAMLADVQSTVLASSYLSNPDEIDAADLKFTSLEMELQNEIDSIETEYPDYDEYSYNLGAIGHNPFTLIGYLSAVHTEFTASEVEREIQALFDEMYELTLTPDTETRGGPDEENEYEVSILRVTLTVKPLETLISGKMNQEQTEIYGTYAETKGLLQQFSSPLDLYWYGYVSSYYGYRKNPNTGNEEFHRGVDIGVPTGTTVYAGHDGTVTTAAYDRYYGNYVVLEQNGYTTKYAHMDTLNVSAGQTVTKGAVLGTTGNTGNSTGSHLHIECLYNGEYYNPLFYFDTGTNTLYGEAPGGNGNVIPPDAYDDAQVQALMEEAARYLGYPYVWGGSSPSTSFDCSGFVCWAFTNSGVHNLPRTTAQGIYDQCTPVSAGEAKAGDIIFFTGTYNSPGPVSHVGIYCGNGVFIHCGDPISYASVSSPYWQSHFYSYGRIS